MKTSNIVIFLIVVNIIAGIFGFAIWDMKDETENVNALNTTNSDVLVLNETQNGNLIITEPSNILNENNQNDVQNNNGIVINQSMYKGEWFISRDEYVNAEQIDELMDRREDRLITDAEFENQLQSLKNDEFAELDVDEYYGNSIKFDFELTGPAPTQRVARIEDMVVELNNNVGTFTYIDNWGTSGNGTITLKDNQIDLKLETTKVNQGTLWGVEGSYTFSYRLGD